MQGRARDSRLRRVVTSLPTTVATRPCMLTVKRTAEDARFSLSIRERDRWTCQRCGTTYPPKHQGYHSAHMFSRGKLNTRFDPENACGLCYGCHRYLDTHPDEKREFFRLRLGDEAFEALELRSNQRGKR